MSNGLFPAAQLQPTGPSGASFPFPCIKCGLCCKNLDKSPVYSYLNRGDGTCINFDSATQLCSVYEVRPLICRVEEYYEKNLSAVMSRDGYIEANIQACRDIQAAANLIFTSVNSEDS